MFCKYCGRQVDEQASFCSSCGARLKAPYIASPQTITPPIKKPVNGLGIAAFVVGIVTLLLGIYIFGIAIAGIVLGSVGVARRNKYRLNGLAIAGLVISCVAFVFWLSVWIILIYTYLFSAFFLLLFLPFLI